MNREFLDLYNRELQLLHEQAREFAEEYPGIAERLGGLVGDRPDPMIAGLLEGAAFLAARVQLKLKHEFSEFTGNLLEQLVPNYLAPTPSALLAKIVPPYPDPALREGSRIARGLLPRRDLSRARPAHRLPLPAERRHHAVAVRHHRRRISSALPARCRRWALPSGPRSSPGCGSRSRTARLRVSTRRCPTPRR